MLKSYRKCEVTWSFASLYASHKDDFRFLYRSHCYRVNCYL